MKPYKYAIGQTWNDWTLIAHISNSDSNKRYLFRCICGKECHRNIGFIVNGKSKGCGCKASKRQSENSGARKHSRFGTLEYKVWEGARRWARNLGLPFQKEWDDFETFMEDVGSQPGPFYWLERKVSKKGWVKGNLEWRERGVLTEETIGKVLKMRNEGVHRSVINRTLHLSSKNFRKALDILIKRGLYKPGKRMKRKPLPTPKLRKPKEVPL